MARSPRVVATPRHSPQRLLLAPDSTALLLGLRAGEPGAPVQTVQ